MVDSGWSDLEAKPAPPSAAEDELARSFVRAFTTNEGAKVLEHLLDRFRNCRFGTDAPGKVLRHAEGRREVVDYIQGMIKRGMQK